MAVSHLTTSGGTLWALVVERLGDEGYPFNSLTTTPSAFLATAVSGLTGQTYSNLTTSFSQLLEVLHNHLEDTDLFNETSGIAELLAGVANALEGGIAGEILLSNSTISEDAAVNDVVGTLSVTSSGTPVFALDDDANGLFSLDGDDVVVAGVLDAETDPQIVVSVSGVTPAISPTPFTITVTEVGGSTPGMMDFSDTENSGLLALLEDI